MAAIPRLRPYIGPAILSYGFRPFFLLGSLYSGAIVLVWLPVFFGEVAIPTTLAPRDWHFHEMLYGYLTAVITGFLLTAIPNWTGRLPIRGMPLLVAVVVWLVGRAAVSFSQPIGWALAAGIDVAFLIFLLPPPLRARSSPDGIGEISELWSLSACLRLRIPLFIWKRTSRARLIIQSGSEFLSSSCF